MVNPPGLPRLLPLAAAVVDLMRLAMRPRVAQDAMVAQVVAEVLKFLLVGLAVLELHHRGLMEDLVLVMALTIVLVAAAEVPRLTERTGQVRMVVMAALVFRRQSQARQQTTAAAVVVAYLLEPPQEQVALAVVVMVDVLVLQALEHPILEVVAVVAEIPLVLLPAAPAS